MKLNVIKNTCEVKMKINITKFISLCPFVSNKSEQKHFSLETTIKYPDASGKS